MTFSGKTAISMTREIERFLAAHDFDCDDKSLLLKRSFNEAWFSNMLAWLLDPKGSHNLGVAFLQEFLKQIARKRSDDMGYKNRSTFLKWRKGGVGKNVTGLTLCNASVSREFFLSGGCGADSVFGQGYCDVVVLDLDSKDGLFLVIENKLFTTNHRNQLEGYFNAVDEKYSRAKIREFVYLTFYGFPPVNAQDANDELLNQYWVRFSWADDVLALLEVAAPEPEHHEVKALISLLKWMNAIRLDGGEVRAKEFRLLILHAAAYCLEEELNRLGEERQGVWSIAFQGNRVKLLHSSNPRSPLTVELLPNLSVAVQGHRRSKATFSKIVVPYGVNADQVFNLLDIAARDIYKQHFGDRVSHYLNEERRRTRSHKTERKREVKPLFDFVSAHCDALRVLFAVLIDVWKLGDIGTVMTSG